MSSGVVIAIIAVVIVVVLLLALLLSGVIPGFKLSSSGTGKSGPSYAVTFSESGLPSGTSWSVMIGGAQHPSTTTTVVVQEQNGTYAWSASATGSYSATPASGSIHVSGGPQSQAITFNALAPGTYSVTFTESGLSSGTAWTVTFNGTLGSSTTTTIVFTSHNGTWPFTVGTVSGYTASPGSGNVVVSGGGSQGISFSSGSGGGGPEKYSQALPVAQTAAGSGWVLIFAYGLDFLSSYTNSSDRGNASCPVTGGPAQWPVIPAYTGDYHNGILSGWIFLFYKASTTSELAVYVTGSSSTVLGQVTGASCTRDANTLAGLGAGIIDSDAAANAFNANSAVTAFLAHNSTASAYFFLIAGNMSSNALWIVTYTTCVPGVTGAGYEVIGEVNASSGVLIDAFGAPATCGTTPFSPAHEVPTDGASPMLLLPGSARAD